MRRALVFVALAVAVAAIPPYTGIDARLSHCDASSPTQLWVKGPYNELQQLNGGACLDVLVS